MKKYSIIAALLLLTLFACRGPGVRDAPEERTVYIVYTDWAESVALTSLVHLLLEEHLGYRVVTRLAGIDTVFMDIASGRADIFVDAWIPHTHKHYLEQHEGEFEDLGPNYHGARTGLVVPEYMAVESIPALRDYYTGPIVGIDTTAGIMRNTIMALQAYELENELLVLSDPEMAERLGWHIRRRENVVITGWEPHWLMHRYDLKFLDDPLEIYMQQESIHTIGRKGFSDQRPAATEMLKRMVLGERLINELIYKAQRHDDPYEGVSEWIRENEFIVNQWLRGLRPEREKIM